MSRVSAKVNIHCHHRQGKGRFSPTPSLILTPLCQICAISAPRHTAIDRNTIGVNEFGGYEEAREKFEQWVSRDYNQLYLYEKLGYRSPEEFEAWHNQELMKKVG